MGIFGDQQEVVADAHRVGSTVGRWADPDVRNCGGTLYLHVILGARDSLHIACRNTPGTQRCHV